MNGEQMKFLADEQADQLMEKLRPLFVLATMSESDQDIVREAISLAFLEGFGRGARALMSDVRSAIR